MARHSISRRQYQHHHHQKQQQQMQLQTAMVFPRPGAVVLRGLSSPKNRVLERDK